MKIISSIILCLIVISTIAVAGTITFSSKEVLTATKLNAAIAEKTDVVRHQNYSTATQAKLNSKVNSGGQGVFSHISTTTTTNRFINLGNTTYYSGTRAAGTIFHNMTTSYYCETDNVCKRFGSGTGAAVDISVKTDVTRFTRYSTAHATDTSKAYVDAQIAGVSTGTLPHFSNYTGADGATWIDKGSTPPSLVTRIADKLYSVVMSLKATLYAILGWSSNSYDFGSSVTVGSYANYSTTLSNTGSYATQSLAFSNLSSGVFRAYSTPTSIAAGSSAKVKYQFTPANTTPHTGHLWASAAGIESKMLTLTGTGINSYIVNNGLDGGSRPSDGGGATWTASTSPAPNYTNTGLTGYTYSTLTNITPGAAYLNVAFSAQTDVYLGVKYKTPATISVTDSIIRFSNASENGYFMLSNTGPKIGVRTLGSVSTAYGSPTVSTNTEYYLKLHYVASTNTTTLYGSSNGTSWTEWATQTTSTNKTGITNMRLGFQSTHVGVFNALRVSSTDFNY